MNNYHDCEKQPSDVEIRKDGLRWYLTIYGDDDIPYKLINFCPFCGLALLGTWVKPELIMKKRDQIERIDTKGGFLITPELIKVIMEAALEPQIFSEAFW